MRFVFIPHNENEFKKLAVGREIQTIVIIEMKLQDLIDKLKNIGNKHVGIILKLIIE